MHPTRHEARAPRLISTAPLRASTAARIALLALAAATLTLAACTVTPGIGIGISGGGGWGWHPTFSAGVHVGGPIW